MALTNAQIQAAYRARHCKDGSSATASRIDTLIAITSKRALQRMAAHLEATQRTVLESLIAKAEADLLASLDADSQRQYYGDKPAKNITG